MQLSSDEGKLETAANARKPPFVMAVAIVSHLNSFEFI